MQQLLEGASNNLVTTDDIPSIIEDSNTNTEGQS